MNLKELWQERASSDQFKKRDKAYKKFEEAYKSEGDNKAPSYMESFKPTLQLNPNSDDDTPKLVNWPAQIVKHFSSMFARMPQMSNTPFDASASSVTLANRMSSFILATADRSSMKAQQPLQAHRLSMRGDAVYGVEWDTAKGQIHWRCFDPAWCYPELSHLDLGGVNDMLIHYKVNRKWAKQNFNVDIDTKPKDQCDVFIYWDADHKEVQVEELHATEHEFKHSLGFVPFRWVFSQPTGDFAQSDIGDLVELNSIFNEGLVLGLDSLRMNTYPAYWGRGIRDGIKPLPGQVIAFNSPEAHVEIFPTAPPPAMVMGMLDSLQKYIQGSGGVSPVSMEGMAGGSIVTGTAVRHQVEAIEARAETKRVMLEAAFGKLAEYTLRILESEFKESALIYRLNKDSHDSVMGKEVRGWTTCTAEYAGFVGLDPANRVRVALEGLGRVWDGYEAIKIANPNINPDEMMQRVTAYQIQQAEMTARAQAAAQKIGQEEGQHDPNAPQGGGQVQGMDVPPPQMGQKPQPPSPSSFMQPLGKIQDALQIVSQQLKGRVWAVGELAIAGQSAQPMLMVEKKEDLAAVQSIAKDFKGMVTVGQPKDLPSTQLV